MGGNRIDQLGAAAGGIIIALHALLQEMPRLRELPQWTYLRLPALDELTVIIQGFGAVGAHAAHILRQRLPGAKVIGISDAAGYLYDEEGLPVEELFRLWQAQGVVTHPYFLKQLSSRVASTKYSTQPNDLLREDAFCLIPAAPIANYLDTDPASRPSVTVDRMGRWTLSVEGANTYSPDPARKAERRPHGACGLPPAWRLHRHRLPGQLLGGVIFAAQEQLIKTPEHLSVPDTMLGDRDAVDRWLARHTEAFATLAEQRRQAAEASREAVIRHNMCELIDLLVSDADMLPCEAAERISVRRIAAREEWPYGRRPDGADSDDYSQGVYP